MHKRIAATFLALLVPSVEAYAAPQGGTPIPGNIVEFAGSTGRFNLLIAALGATGLAAALDGSQTSERFTVFAPTDDAFLALAPGSTVPELLNDLPRLTDILLYHVAAGGLLASDVLGGATVDTLNGQRLDVSTVGSAAFLDQSEIFLSDVLASNGVIHVIDRVLLPNENNIVETAAAAPPAAFLSHLLEFLPTLEQTVATGEFTVFAPENAAFQMFSPNTLRSLAEPAGLATLEAILSVHVVPGRLYADDVIAAGSLLTVGGKVLPVTTSGGNVFVDGAQVILADIDVANGNIHFIDTVLMP